MVCDASLDMEHHKNRQTLKAIHIFAPINEIELALLKIELAAHLIAANRDTDLDNLITMNRGEFITYAHKCGFNWRTRLFQMRACNPNI